MEQHGTSSLLYNHDRFNALREGEMIRVYLKRAAVSAVCVCLYARARTIGRALKQVRQMRSLHSLTKHLKSLLVV